MKPSAEERQLNEAFGSPSDLPRKSGDFPPGHTVFAEGEPGGRSNSFVSGEVTAAARRMAARRC
jgi:hypothetical protein